MMRSLVVNADDLGADEARNEGIFEAIEAGVVTSASVLANGPALGDALSRIRALKKKDVSFGFHLNLSQGKPLGEGHRLIVGPDGCFPGKTAARELLLQQGNGDLEEEAAREMEAQFLRLRKAGLDIRHMDGHQHVHIFPAVAPATLRLAERHGIRWVRLPEEPPPSSAGRLRREEAALREEAEMFSGLASRARVHFDESRVMRTDAFRGLYLKGRLSVELLEDVLKNLPGGLTELMVHPGRAAVDAGGPFSYFSTADRWAELKALMDTRFRDALVRQGVRLVSFPDA
jgi:predicted glycoside hydrolase/deacetylase ChbG (UPF0249 family)